MRRTFQAFLQDVPQTVSRREVSYEQLPLLDFFREVIGTVLSSASFWV